MLSTAEIRWFLKGEVPKELFAWFSDFDSLPGNTQKRTDHYLRLPGDAIGIKIREGMIEHKQKRDGVGEKWGNGVCSGNIQFWQKWSFPLDHNDAVKEMLKTYPESWQGVIKERSMRILEFDTKGKLRNTSFDKVTGTALGWELTKIKTEGAVEKWWTMGFEAFGSENELKETLIKVCNAILADYPLKLTEESCYSYPSWLSSISDF